VVDIVGGLFNFHVVVLGRPLEVVQDDVTGLVAIVGLATSAIQTHSAFTSSMWMSAITQAACRTFCARLSSASA
jgi:hypothetical protein